MFLVSIITTLHITFCFGYVGYEIFQGFDPTTASSLSTNMTTLASSEAPNLKVARNKLQALIKEPKFNCTEKELPSNIGAYEIPTHRDLILMIRKKLTKMFNSYHERALYFLQDITQASKATSEMENKCHSIEARTAFANCVKKVSKRCEIITKSLVTSLEHQRADVLAFLEVSVCNLNEIKADPVRLIKTLAMEEVSLDFSLPGFLRLLGSCSAYCKENNPIHPKSIKYLREIMKQDLFVRYFLTKKDYLKSNRGFK